MPVSPECAAALLSFRYPSIVQDHPQEVITMLKTQV